MKNIKIETFPVGSFSCNCSLIYSTETKESIIIDPGDDLQQIDQEITKRGLKVKALLHTHAHFDHIGCSHQLAQKVGAKTYLHKEDEQLYKALPMQAMMFGRPVMEVGQIDEFLDDQMSFSINELEDQELKNFLVTIFTPGHTEGSCCFYTDIFETPILFAGDTLFRQSIGRTDLPGGDFEKIKKSIKQRLFHLPDETHVITGHGPATRIFEEKRSNPFV